MTSHRRHVPLHRFMCDPTYQHQMSIIRRIADAVGVAERNFQRAVGTEWIDAYLDSWAVADETYTMLAGPDRPVMLTRFRTIERKS